MPPRETVLVVVNGKKITDADLNRWLMTRKVSEEKRSAERDRFIEQLIDTRLIQQFLDSTRHQSLEERAGRTSQPHSRRGQATWLRPRRSPG